MYWNNFCKWTKTWAAYREDIASYELLASITKTPKSVYAENARKQRENAETNALLELLHYHYSMDWMEN